MVITRNAGDIHAKGWRWHFQCSRRAIAICLWAPWRVPSRPLIYWWGIFRSG